MKGRLLVVAALISCAFCYAESKSTNQATSSYCTSAQLLERQSTRGRFVIDTLDKRLCDDQTLAWGRSVYRPDACALKTFSSADFAVCLQRRRGRLVFIGDSLNNQHTQALVGWGDQVQLNNETELVRTFGGIPVTFIKKDMKRVKPPLPVALCPGDVVIFSFAAHYNSTSKASLEADMVNLLNETTRVAGVAYFLKEFAPTHFPSIDGTWETYMESYDHSPKARGCSNQSLEMIHSAQSWRNDIMNAAVRKWKQSPAGSHVDFRVLRVFNMLADQWQGHKSSLSTDGTCCSRHNDCYRPEKRRGGLDCLHWNTYATTAVHQLFAHELCHGT